MYLTKLVGARRLVLFGALLTVVFLGACSPRGSGSPAPIEETAIKPSPQVVDITASTVGFYEDFQVILDASIKNGGAAGVIIVIASVTQSGSTSTKQMPVFVDKGKTQVVRFVFPIKWKGGDWTPSVTTELP